MIRTGWRLPTCYLKNWPDQLVAYLLNKNLEGGFMTFSLFRHPTIELYNAHKMKSKSTNQEILLMSNASFFNREWSELNNNKNDKQLSQREKLIHLCWNGMLKDMIPEIIQSGTNNNPLTLWEINQAGNLLDLRYGDFDQLINDELSINPYIFTKLAVMN